MNSSNINIIEFPSNLGLKKLKTENEPGVKKLPGWLRKHGFHDKIKPAKIIDLKPPNYSMNLDRKSGVRNTAKIIKYAKEQSNLLLSQLNNDCFQVILGGDCSILIGNAIALKQIGNYRIVFS